MMELKIIRLFEAVIRTNEGKLKLYVKTDAPDLEEATEKAKDTAKAIFVSNLIKVNSFEWAYLDKVSVIMEDKGDDQDRE